MSGLNVRYYMAQSTGSGGAVELSTDDDNSIIMGA